jgi:propanol-preferring alcohol dehydrogenase
MRESDVSMKVQTPLTLGHEGVGRVIQVGPGVDEQLVKVGDRVCVPAFSGSCENCRACWEGWETACEDREMMGIMRDGTFAQFVAARATYVCKIPENVSDAEAAPINCAGVTVYKALKETDARCGQTVVIVGASGGLGYYGIQYANAMGLRVIAVDKGEERIQFCKQFPLIAAIDADKEDVAQKIMELTEGHGADAALILAPDTKAFEEAPDYLRHRGVMVCVAVASGKVEFDMTSLVVQMITLKGSAIGTRADLREAMDLLSRGVIKSEVQVRKFEEINDILDELAAGKYSGRVVVEIPDPMPKAN